MRRLASATSSEDFVKTLGRWRRLWRRRAGPAGGISARRHAKSLARKHIKRFKRLHNVSQLPRLQTGLSADRLWMEAGAEDVKLVFPPEAPPANDIADASRDARRRLKRALRGGIAIGDKVHVDLVNSGNAAYRRLPSLADRTVGESRTVRGLYLQAVGAAIVPYLSPDDVTRLTASGATVIDNQIIGATKPVAVSEPAGTASAFWHLAKIGAHAAHARNLRGAGVTIGILDTGINADHPEFAGKSIDFRAFAENGSPLPAIRARDYETHGTHVAAICAGATAGVAPEADLAVAAVLTARQETGEMCGFLMQIMAGIDWLALEAGRRGDGVDLINASLGGADGDEKYYETVLGHRVAGKLMVAAIGNLGENGIDNHNIPGRFDCVLAVGASDINDDVAYFSAWGRTYAGSMPTPNFKPDLVAPGVRIKSAIASGAYAPLSGTSMACPMVSGAAALLIQQDSSLRDNPDALITKILSLTSSLPKGRHTSDPRRYGYGRLDLAGL